MGIQALPNRGLTFAEFLAEHLTKPFVVGENDCIIFCNKWAMIATGKNYLDDIPKWKTARQGAVLIARYGGLERLLDDRLKRINPRLAKDGDIALHDGQNRVCLFSGNYIVGPAAKGLVRINRMEARCAWSF